MSQSRASEQLRQERETFNQTKLQCARWFSLRLAMGIVGLLLLPMIAIVSMFVIIRPDLYAPATVTRAYTTLIADMIPIGFCLYRLVLRHDTSTRLKPITISRPRKAITKHP